MQYLNTSNSDSLLLGLFGDRIPVEARFSAPVQTGPVTLPASYALGTRSFSEVKRTGRGVNHPLLSRAKIKERVELYLHSPSVPSLQSYKVKFTFISKHSPWVILLYAFRDSVLFALAKDNVTFKSTVLILRKTWLVGAFGHVCRSLDKSCLLAGEILNGKDRYESPAYSDRAMGDDAKHMHCPCHLKCSAGLWANFARFFSGLYC
jgi:hypothetical protein